MTLDLLSQQKRQYERVALKAGMSPSREIKEEKSVENLKLQNKTKGGDDLGDAVIARTIDQGAGTVASSVLATSRGAHSGRGQLNRHRFRREFLEDTMRNFKQLSLKAYDRPVDPE